MIELKEELQELFYKYNIFGNITINIDCPARIVKIQVSTNVVENTTQK